MVVRMLRSALLRPELSPQDAIDIMQYHLQRNCVARASHRKTWLARHKKIAEELLL